VIKVSHTLPRNPGSKMKPFVIISCLKLLMRRSVIRKVWPLYSILSDTINAALVLRQCALEADLVLSEAGVKTEVGEKGLTLRCVIEIYE
jgi:hypothetical protein